MRTIEIEVKTDVIESFWKNLRESVFISNSVNSNNPNLPFTWEMQYFLVDIKMKNGTWVHNWQLLSKIDNEKNEQLRKGN